MLNLVPNVPQSVIHYLASFLTSLAFAFSLRLGNMVDPHKVLTFLISPFSSAFDPSLVFLAGSALPLAALLHRYAGVEQPSFSGNPNIPTSTKIDLRLVLGSVIFGMGWGISGVCRTCTADHGRQYFKHTFYFSWTCSSQFRTFSIYRRWLHEERGLACIDGPRWLAG
jgi:hypothetical protein